jgi:serine-type D-Ala-D-Ala carboxypeptidase/endopeptidase (penicillin-binding protein 4)
MRRGRAAGVIIACCVMAGCAAVDNTEARETPESTGAPVDSTSSTTGIDATTSVASASTSAVPTTVTDPSTTTAVPIEVSGAVGTALFPIVTAMPPDSCAVVTRGGQVVMDVRGGQALTPASNEKVLTAVTALTLFGPEHRLTTEVRSRAPIEADGVIRGDLWLVGGGDRFLSTFGTPPAWEGPPQQTYLDTLADQLRDAGVTRVTGRVIGDDFRYDQRRLVPTWPERFRNRNIIVPLSALTVDSEGEFDGSRQPPAVAAEKLVRLLRDRGIAVDGGFTSGSAATGDTAPIAQVQSPTMEEMVGQMLRESDNTTAELLVREVGRKLYGVNTSGGGSRGIQETIASFGIDVGGLDAVDGSGLDVNNKVSCRTLVQVLDRYGADSPLSRGLAVAGRTGTLASRFEGSPATDRFVGKTGVIAGVATLSGFVTSPDGTVSTFALLVNGDASEEAGAARWRAFVETLASIGANGEILPLG